jgi:hypothetical protein
MVDKNEVIKDIDLDLVIDTTETLEKFATGYKEKPFLNKSRMDMTQADLMRERFGLTKKTHTKKRKKRKK